MNREVSVTLELNSTPVTDASVTLSDAAGTYGIREAVSDTVVVAAGTVVPHVGGGIYTFIFDSAEPGTAYEAVARIAWADGTVDFVERTLAAIAPAGAADAPPHNRMSRLTVLDVSNEAIATLENVRVHLRINQETASSGGLGLMLAAATDYAQDAMECSLIPQTLLATFYDGEPLFLPRGPLLSIVSVTDARGHPAAYELRHSGLTAEVIFTSGIPLYPVSVTYRAGYATAAAIPAAIKLAILAHVGAMYENRESVSDKTMTPVPQHLADFYRLKRRGRSIA